MAVQASQLNTPKYVSVSRTHSSVAADVREAKVVDGELDPFACRLVISRRRSRLFPRSPAATREPQRLP